MYLTEERRIAVNDANDESLYETCEDFVDSDRFGPRLVADVGDALGETRGPRTKHLGNEQ